MCLGGHLAYRSALDARVVAAVCYFATDIHSHSLGHGMKDDSLERAGDIRAELIMVSLERISSHRRMENLNLKTSRSLAKRIIMFLQREETL